MSPSHNRARRVTVRRSVVSALAIAMILCSFPPSQAEVSGAQARKLVDSVINLLRKPGNTSKRSGGRVKPRQADTAAQREARVSHVRLCPRRLLLYIGEQFTLVPLPLDQNKEVVQGIAFEWESSDSTTADVASDGSVTALKSGRCSVTASVGNKKDKVNVEVRDGRRPFLGNAQWDIEHGHDCDDPEQAPSATNSPSEVNASGVHTNSHKGTIRPSVVKDPDDPPNVRAAGSTVNAAGNMRFTPAEVPQGAPGKAKNQLGSSNFGMTIPIFDSPGRGISTSVALVYNSRPWTKDGTNMVFDYDQGWPAPGFRLNYGRIIPNYDVPAGYPGNYLLIEADGTRTPLIAQPDAVTYRSNDGRFIDFDINSAGLSYPDGTVIFYAFNGSKLVPNSIKDINGNSISISYVTSCADAQRTEACTCAAGCTRPQRQAINQISDTLGRLVTFYYKADGNLAEVRVAGFNGASDRTVVKFSYQSLALSYNFGTMTVTNVPDGNQVDVLHRVYFPDTGRGYIFEPYSSYGMCTRVSMRLGMTDVSDGNEVAFSEYVYQTTGALSDSPQFTERHEWWQGKTDDSGTLQDSTHPAVFTYGRTADNTSNWVIAPNGVKTESVSNGNTASSQFGLVGTQRVIRTSDAKVFSQQDFTYNDRTSTTGLQRTSVVATDDAGNQAKTTSTFGSYGRLMELKEYGFQIGGAFKPRRVTDYAYVDDVNYINLYLRQLVTDIKVWDTKGDNDPSNDALIARAGFAYDAPDAGWEIETYGFTQNCSPPGCTPPPGFATRRIDRVQRGNVTKLQSWSDATAQTAQINFRRRHDIFGNQVKIEVSCCSLKRFTYSPDIAGLHYSLPVSVTDGPEAGGPNLTTSFAYDFNTSFLNSQTDPSGLVTSYAPDAAMRLRTVTYPKLATDTNANPTLGTFYVDAQNNPSSTDTLAYQSRFTYFDGPSQKVQVSNQWLDGTGRTVRTGSASGPTVASFDAVKSIYDDLGRLRKSTNPYNTTNPDGDTTGLPNATVYDYDSLSRVATVTLPDQNTVTTSYNGAVATVTDQVGRQRKSEVDGLARVVTVTEQDPVTGSLTLATNYTYDMSNNLTGVDQGGQTRGFSYDSLSRMISETTPEGGAVSFTYTDFGAVVKRTDARTVQTHYHYDSLNRLDQVWYTGPNGSDDPNATRPALPGGVAATSDVILTYNNFATPQPGNGQVSTITDGAGSEGYAYDPLARVQSKTRVIDSSSYQTQYQYNQASQLNLLIYPSGKRVKMTFDGRGRLSGEDNVDGANNVLTSYVSSIGYNGAGQVTGLNLGNGVNETYGYSADRLQLTSQTATSFTGTLINLKYIYQTVAGDSGVGTTANNSGQLMMISGTIGPQSRTQRFTYDDLGRLATATGKGLWGQSYSYDRWGNRTVGPQHRLRPGHSECDVAAAARSTPRSAKQPDSNRERRKLQLRSEREFDHGRRAQLSL
jgi:YD repeat-containing protein